MSGRAQSIFDIGDLTFSFPKCSRPSSAPVLYLAPSDTRHGHHHSAKIAFSRVFALLRRQLRLQSARDLQPQDALPDAEAFYLAAYWPLA